VSVAFDVVVVGAGHNGLTTAALLARRGRKVLVVERRDVAGGIASGDEFHPGYRSGGLLQDTTGVRESVVRELALEGHGLRRRDRPHDVLALGDDGRSLFLYGDRERAGEEIARHSEADAAAYPRMLGFVDRVRGALAGFLDEPPLDLIHLESAGVLNLLKRGLGVRRLGRREMLELLRLPPMSVADWLGEWFESDLLQAALALPALAGTNMGPRSPGSNANLLLYLGAARGSVEGGGPALVKALEAAAGEQGVELRCGASVERILCDAEGVRGVLLAGGEEISTRIVAASCDPRHALLDLLSPGTLEHRLERRMRKWRLRGTTAQVLLALSTSPRFAGRENEIVEFARTGSSLDDIERAHDATKYRQASEHPVLELHVPTVSNPDLAPEGHAVLAALVHFAPYDLGDGWSDETRRHLGDRVVEILERHAPGIRESVVGGAVLSPADLEAQYGLSGGHVHHGEHALDQRLIRPAPECVGYRTPVPGLWLCGSGTHPGGGLTCAPGALAAGAIERGQAKT